MSNGLIGLREGLEAGVIVMIIVAFLKGYQRRSEIRLVWLGVAAALVVSVIAGVILALTATKMSGRAEDLFMVGASLVAVVFITGMVFWMRHSAQETQAHIEGKVSRAMLVGPSAVFLVAFIAVLREGLEASIFVLVLADGGNAAASVGGLLAGVGVSVVLTYLLHVGLIRMNMARFLRITSWLLVFIGAGILAHLVTDLQKLGVLPWAEAFAFDATAILPMTSWWGHMVEGLAGLSSQPTILALATWATYVVVVVPLVQRALRRRGASSESLARADA